MKKLLGLILFIGLQLSIHGKIGDTITILNNMDGYIENPNHDLIESEYMELREEGMMVSFIECSDYYFIQGNDTIDFISKVTNELNILELPYFEISCRLFTDWKGVIREVKIIIKEGEPDVEKIKEVLTGLKSTQLTRFGYGIDSKCSVKIANKN